MLDTNPTASIDGSAQNLISESQSKKYPEAYRFGAYLREALDAHAKNPSSTLDMVDAAVLNAILNDDGVLRWAVLHFIKDRRANLDAKERERIREAVSKEDGIAPLSPDETGAKHQSSQLAEERRLAKLREEASWRGQQEAARPRIVEMYKAIAANEVMMRERFLNKTLALMTKVEVDEAATAYMKRADTLSGDAKYLRAIANRLKPGQCVRDAWKNDELAELRAKYVQRVA